MTETKCPFFFFSSQTVSFSQIVTFFKGQLLVSINRIGIYTSILSEMFRDIHAYKQSLYL